VNTRNAPPFWSDFFCKNPTGYTQILALKPDSSKYNTMDLSISGVPEPNGHFLSDCKVFTLYSPAGNSINPVETGTIKLENKQ
jgi:hypothetical protein